ncbi:F-box domain containing protein [Trema orientale]|uniref:F-box domain containing protein n=1 Tax=Trema orientale TaxID=63057 RepID=A0A2P5D2U6_TREOI|nr:F-box domain containing protein [Trema orientale]
MESSSGSNDMDQQRKIQNTFEGIDYISHLPEAIILYILSFLPIKDLIVVSLLSRLWKNMVMNHLSIVPSSLNLDELEMIRNFIRRSIQRHQSADFLGASSSSQCLTNLIHSARRQYMDFVNRTLFLHSGCIINHLQLSFCYDGSDRYTRRVTSWVRFALTNKIKELDLDFSKGELLRPSDSAQPYELPNGSFCPNILHTLTLTYCKLKAASFGVLISLQKLCLRQVKVIEGSIGELVSKCPVLEDVSLEHCVIPNEFMVSEEDIKIKRLSLIDCKTEEWPMFSIDISTPDLLMLTIVGRYLMTSSIRKAFRLREVFIDIEQIYADHVQGDALGSLLDGFGHCKTLTLTTWCIQVLPTGENLLQKLPIPLENLEHLKLVAGMVKQELPGIACLLRSCPNLKILTLIMQDPVHVDWAEFEEDIPDILDFEEHSYWELQNLPFRCLQTSLKQVKINGFTGKSNEVLTIKFLLENAVVLENMEVFYAATNMFAATIAEQQLINTLWFQDNSHYLQTFSRASPRVQIAVFRNLNFNM